jgi:hypothetical protein
MPDRDGSSEVAKPRSAPAIVSPTKNTRNSVNLALPFSKIEVAAPSKDLAQLASVVADLITALQGALPDAALRELRERSARIVDSVS